MLPLILLVALAGACLAAPVSRLLGRAGGWGLALLPAGLFGMFLSFAPLIAGGGVAETRLPWAPSLGVELAFRLDGFSFLFALLITGIGTLVVVYAGAYMAEKSPGDRARFFTLILLFMTAMLGAVLSDNLLVFFMFWEATSILSFLLVGFDGKSPASRRSALQSLQVTVGGGLGLLCAIVLIGITLGSFSFSGAGDRAEELARSPWVALIVIGLLLGGFTKSAQFPFHFWLPNAMQAPTPASAYLHSATMVKLGIYLLARFEGFFAEVPGGRSILIGFAAATMLVAGVQALRAQGFKAALAYSTVASLGILVMLIGLDGPMASVATVGFILAHALYKAALFFCAGNAIHATGKSHLRQMGGLVRFLPLTAVAASLASLSMAGLPPFIGFISKEFLFEAQIQSSWDAVPVAIAVLVNAVMVGVAGVVSLRPFFLGHGKITEVKHGETVGLTLGPLLLSLLGLAISLEPEWVRDNVLNPAVLAIYGQPVEVKVELWHGLTPMLMLSLVVVAIGAVIVTFWRSIHTWLLALQPIDHYAAEIGYDALMRGLVGFARRLTRFVQNGDLRRYLWLAAASAMGLCLFGAVRAGTVPRWPEFGRFDPATAAILLVGLAGGFAAARARSLLSALVAVGLVGLAVALVFLRNGAPDLALTQFSVEALIVVLLTAVLLVLPLAAPVTRNRVERQHDILLSCCFAALVFLATADMLAGPAEGTVSAFYGAQSYVAAFGQNVVNVILVDFRGFDTLGETVVIGMSALMAWSLLKADPVPARDRPAAFILTATSRAFFALLLVAAVMILLRGHNQPGGGFVGGLVAALAFAMLALAGGVERARAALRLHPMVLVGLGMGLAVLSGVPGLLAHGSYLKHIWVEAHLLGLTIKQGTTLLFDLGVFAVVLGGVLAYLFGLQREAER